MDAEQGERIKEVKEHPNEKKGMLAFEPRAGHMKYNTTLKRVTFSAATLTLTIVNLKK
jgi:hypothetical protein